MNKLILSTGCLYHKPLSDTFLLAKKAGYDGIEVMIDNNPESQSIEKLNKLSKKYDIPILSLHMPLDKCSAFGDSPQKILVLMTKMALRLNVKNMVFHPSRKDNREYYQNLKGAIKNLDYEITIMVENLPDNGKYNKKVQNPVMLSRDFRDICLDTSHLATTKFEFKKSVDKVRNKISHVHFSDSIVSESRGIIIDDHLPLGQGKLPLKWIVRLLEKSGYCGMYCIELRPELFDKLSDGQAVKVLSSIRRRYDEYQ